MPSEPSPTLRFVGSAPCLSGLVDPTTLREIPGKLGVTARLGDADEAREFQFALDTGSQWSVLRADVASTLGLPVDDVQSVEMKSWRGPVRGPLVPCVPLLLHATPCPLLVEVTFLVAVDWSGPNVLGWQGALDKLRFALDPSLGPSDPSFVYWGRPE